MVAEEPFFLALADVISIHKDQIERYGGQSGIREMGLLQSALAMPQASFSGEWLHRDLYEMGAAYVFHLSQNHPFVDGNKRTAFMCALVFLGLNDQRLEAKDDSIYELVDGVAAGRIDKSTVAVFLRDHCRNR